jgi:serine phosphatase RsbU (regulator of sigma subunit)
MEKYAMNEIEKQISHLSIFKSLSPDDAKQLAQVVNLIHVSDGSILLREGESGDRFYVILEGQVAIYKALGTREESLLGLRNPGDYLGEMSLLNWDGLRTASAQARGEVRLIEITREDFDNLLKKQPELVFEMVREMSHRLTNSQATAIQVLQEKNRQLQQALDDLKAAQAQLIEKEKLERELEVAREIQLSILPRTLPCVDGYDLGALIVPARAVGGDFFDVFPLDKDHLGIVIGDVTDKGVPAAIYMAQTRALLRAKASPDLKPIQTLKLINQILLNTNDSGMFVTMLYGSLDLGSGELDYARAGHEVPLVLRASGEKMVLPYSPGVPLGIIERPVLDQQRAVIEPGDLLLLYTDGVTDGLNLGSDAVGTEMLEQMTSEWEGLDAQQVCTQISEQVNIRQHGQPQFDDVTLVAIRLLSQSRLSGDRKITRTDYRK